MFWKRGKDDQKGARLPGPRDLPELVRKQMAAGQSVDSGMLPFLKAVTKPSEQNEKTQDIYVYDPSDADAREIKVQNYESLKSHPELVLSEGWFNESEKKVELSAKKVVPPVRFYSKEEILHQIEGLKDAGSSIFYYMAAGTGAGGPLGRGAAVISLNPTADGKKAKKYAIFNASVIDGQPSKNLTRIWDSDKAKDVAEWVASSHKPRFC